jgi:hypothetical protein
LIRLLITVRLALSPPAALAQGCGTAWQAVASPTSEKLEAVCFAQGQFLAVGEKGVILRSADGATWTSQTTSVSDHLMSVGYGGSCYLAVGVSPNQSPIYRSTDGSTWTPVQSLPDKTATLLDVAYLSFGGGAPTYFVGGNASSYPAVWKSADGASWSGCEVQTGGERLWPYSLACSDSVAVAAGFQGGVLLSSDGFTWKRKPPVTGSDLYSVAYGNGWFVAVGEGGTVIRSQDGSTWTASSSGTAEDLWECRFQDNRFFALGNGGTLLTSPNGEAWTAVNSGTLQDLRGTAFSGTVMVAVGDGGTILRSACDPGALSLVSVAPGQGPSEGGTAVILAGSGFEEGAQVTFGGVPATGVQFISEAQMACVTPAHDPGTVDVTVTLPGGDSASLYGGFTYTGGVTPPVIAGVTKAGNPFRIKIAGSNFQSGLAVTIGSDGNPWSQTTRKSDLLIVLKGGSALKAKFPQGQPVEIRVRNPDGGEDVTIYTRP